MPTIFIGPDNKAIGIRYHQIFVANLPVAEGAFPLHVKEAVLANPLLENSFMSFDRFAAQRPRKTPSPTAKAPAVLKGPPIKKRPGLQKK